MIARTFHAWERRLASVDTNRVVRPFEWGLDWLPPGAGRAGGENAADVIERWVAEEVMRDTHAFFTPPPTDAFEFTPADPER